MKRIEEYEKEILAAASEHFNRHGGSGVMYLCGKRGMGKTLLARQYVKDHGGLYFSFRNLDAALAPIIFFPDCSNWDSFFQKILETKIAQSSFSMTWTIGMIKIFSWRNCLC